jgi:uncharacterized damage-inducible protein DinB
MTNRVFILGAGASRDCQSADGHFQSPLSKDFFELLERVHGEDPTAVRVAHIQGYLIAHDAHHRGSTVLTLKQCGHAVPENVRYGIWKWDKL